MLSNACAAALRHLGRNRLQACVAVFGLALGLCTALIAALVLRNQYSFDHDVPAHERTYVIVGRFQPPGLAPQYVGLSLLDAATELKARFPEIEAVSRAFESGQRLRYGDRVWRENVYWADPNLFDLLPPTAVAGNPGEALRSADGLVLSRKAARRFFGRDAPLGEPMLVEDEPMIVRAVIEDPPPNTTHAQSEIIASSLSQHSPMNADGAPGRGKVGRFVIVAGKVYIRFRAAADISRVLKAVPEMSRPEGDEPQMFFQELVRLDRLHTHEGLNPGFSTRMSILALLGGGVLGVAGINFVNLQTARSMQRAKEMAVRRLAGASRGRLIAQLFTEALGYSLAATLLTLALVEWLLPYVNSFLDTGATLDYFGDPALAAAVVTISVLLGLLAGAWPAFVVSGLRPRVVLRGAMAAAAGGRARRILVALQFAMLIGLAICVGVVHLQRNFAMHEALRMDRDQVVIVSAQGSGPLVEQIRRLPGVRAVTRANAPFLGSTGYAGKIQGISVGTTQTAKGNRVSVHGIGVDFDLFDFYGIAPIAGRLPRADGTAPRAGLQRAVVLNETAVRRFELGTPQEAIGKPVATGNPNRPNSREEPNTVLAVVPDFSLSPIQEAIPPIAYYQLDDDQADLINVRLAGRDIPETLQAIDQAWLNTGDNRKQGSQAPLRFFLDEHIQLHYVSVLRESQAFGICALIAIALSCIGLYALTASAAARRTREIGLRKALGAQTTAVVRLLLWQFTQPVAWGVLLAWPVAAWLMQRWLDGFAYRIDLPLWLFPVAAGAAVLIAVATVAMHTLSVARTRPSAALRYE